MVIKIEIVGEPKSGKSLVGNMIYRTLKKAGFYVQLFDDEKFKGDWTISKFEIQLDEEKIKVLKDKTRVEIKTVHARIEVKKSKCEECGMDIPTERTGRASCSDECMHKLWDGLEDVPVIKTE